MAVNTLIQVRRGSAAQWNSANPELGEGILYRGEIGYETDTGRFKIGDGSTAWSSGLNYASVLPGVSGIDANYGFAGIDGIEILDPNGDGSYLTFAVSGIQSTQINDFTTAVQNIVDADSIDMEQVQDIIGESGVAAGFGVHQHYNDSTGYTYISITGTPVDISAVSGMDVVRAVSNSTVDGQTVTNYTYTVAPVDTLLDLSQNLGSTAAELNVLDGVSPGTVSAGDAVVVDGSKDIFGFNTVAAVNFLGNISGDLTGNASTADQVKTQSTATNATNYVTFVDSNNGSATNETVYTDAGLFYNPSTNLLNVDGGLQVGGDLTVAGTTTTVNSTVVEIGDNIIRVNTSGLATGGIEVKDGSNVSYKQLVWDNVDSRWEVGTENLQANRFVSTVTNGTSPLVVASTTAVTNLNSDLLDGEHGSYYRSWNNATDKPDPIITVALTGDVSASGSYTWTDLNGDVSLVLNSTVLNNSVALGDDTTGDYVESISVAGTGLSIDVTSGEGQTPTITSNATPANTNNALVARDSSGGFSAGLIVATGFSGNGSQITNINASNISTGTLNSARLPSVSQTNTTTGPTANFVSSLSVDSYGRVTGFNTTTHTLATTTVKGIASFNSSDFTVAAGAVSISTSGVSNTQLVNNSITFGSTEVELGSSSNRIDGLVAISGASAAVPTVLSYCLIDGGSP